MKHVNCGLSSRLRIWDWEKFHSLPSIWPLRLRKIHSFLLHISAWTWKNSELPPFYIGSGTRKIPNPPPPTVRAGLPPDWNWGCITSFYQREQTSSMPRISLFTITFTTDYNFGLYSISSLFYWKEWITSIARMRYDQCLYCKLLHVKRLTYIPYLDWSFRRKCIIMKGLQSNFLKTLMKFRDFPNADPS